MFFLELRRILTGFRLNLAPLKYQILESNHKLWSFSVNYTHTQSSSNQCLQKLIKQNVVITIERIIDLIDCVQQQQLFCKENAIMESCNAYRDSMGIARVQSTKASNNESHTLFDNMYDTLFCSHPLLLLQLL